ncbi:alpha/beta fold hydrolase [Streptomyces sp. IBSBF 3352]|uniref:alpha/beta fold hydrolase n=1 Tax=Streptomyces sp. IBSBF 3352 TaxID=2903523 RepID=UPI002FDC1183
MKPITPPGPRPRGPYPGRPPPFLPRLRRPGTPPARPARPLQRGPHVRPPRPGPLPALAGRRPDQRGHGFSDRGPDFSREGYIADATALLTHLGLERPVVLGHSLGGVNAYQFAARHPGLVRALVIEDIGTEIDDDLSFCLSWPHRAPTARP